MITPLAARALEQSGAFAAVVRGRSAAAADLVLETDLVRLEQDFTVKPSRIELALHARLIDLRDRRVLATRELRAREDAPSDDPYGGVTAANRALARVLGELSAFCAENAPPR
jgi:cholesterol transport system auxiliary component